MRYEVSKGRQNGRGMHQFVKGGRDDSATPVRQLGARRQEAVLMVTGQVESPKDFAGKHEVHPLGED